MEGGQGCQGYYSMDLAAGAGAIWSLLELLKCTYNSEIQMSTELLLDTIFSCLVIRLQNLTSKTLTMHEMTLVTLEVSRMWPPRKGNICCSVIGYKKHASVDY